MLEVEVTDEFKRRYRELPLEVKKKAEKQERMFHQNPFYPSLRTEKLEPKSKQVWSFRIDKRYRIFFRFDTPEKVTFLTVGPHDWVYKFWLFKF